MNRPSSTTESTELLGATEQSSDRSPSPDPLVQILAAIRGLGVRLNTLEQRLEHLDRHDAIGSPSIDPDTAKPEGDGDLLAEIEASDARVIADLPRAEKAAHYREMIASLHRAVAAAKLLGAIDDVNAREEAPEPKEDEEAPTTEPAGSHRRSLAILSDGRVALSLAYVEGADLSGYERWDGIILPPERAKEVLDDISDAADNVAANVGGSIRWKKKDEPNEGGA